MAFFSFRALLVSVAALFSATLLFDLSLPLLQHLSASVLPQIWCSVVSWLAPPYVYLVVNGIIISIAASSKFRPEEAEPKDLAAYDADAAVAEIRPDFEVPVAYEAVVLKDPADLRVLECGEEASALALAGEGVQEDQEFADSRSDWDSRRGDPTEDPIPKEKPLVSGRFGHRNNKKSREPSPEGKRALPVAKPKQHETLEGTWKAITEGRSIPLARHLKKSDTWETHVCSDGHDPVPFMKKSETMNDRTTLKLMPSPGSDRLLLRKQSSLSQEELNQRVEAFIQKFNEEMRLQKEKSLQNYMEMVNQEFQ